MYLILFIPLSTFLNLVIFASTSAAVHNNSMISNIFCSGKILHYVQISRIFNDSKYFVDMKLKFAPWKVEDDFNKLLNITNDHPDNNELKLFVERNFDPPGAGFEPWIPGDWKSRPKFINKIDDVHLQKWAMDLNARWTKLGREISEDVLKDSSLYSQLFVPYPFIVPGGRFREFYYWDSYWIIEGLLLSEMFDTSQKMLRNFLYLVESYGFVPNGGRVYYLERSQPPLLIPMFDLYWEASKDHTLLEESILTLEKEFNFWMKNRTINVIKDEIKYKVFQYHAKSNNARPESFYEDTLHAQGLSNDSKKLYFSEIKTAAESGWDFSSRWFISNGERTTNLSDIHPSYLAPVCLNSIMCNNANLLSKFYLILGNEDKSKEYQVIAETINKTISRVFWDDEKGMWFDYNIVDNKLQPGFYPSNLFPLWTKSYGVEREREYIGKKVLSYLSSINLTSYPGGVPTSLLNSSQQWDLPNGWAPLQYIIVLGLRNLGETNKDALLLAKDLAEKWIINCYITYENSTPHSMFEKYDVTKVGIPGGGGEYSNQQGFGWTNGVAMKFLSLYGHQIETSKNRDPVPLVLGCVLFIIICIAAICFSYKLKLAGQKRKHTKFTKLESIKMEENYV